MKGTADMEEDTGWFRRVPVRINGLLGALVLLCGLICGLVLAGSAAADPAPLWSDPITTSAWAAYGAGGREALYVNELQAGMLDTERVIGPDGAVEYQAETGSTTITPPALAVDGSGYVLRGGGAAGVIDAIGTAGQVRWSYTVPAEDTVRTLLAGNDGAAYIIVSNAIDDEVLRLSPVDGSVSFDTPLPDGTYSDGYLFAEPSGVAAVTGTHVLFLSQQGQVTADVQAFPSGSATVFTSNNAGDVFVGTAPIVGSEVNLTNGLSVSKVDPSGQLDWTTLTPATGEELGSMTLAALPDGGVAYEVADQSVGALNADGTTRWNSNNPLGYGAMLADSAGHLDFERVLSNQNCSDMVVSCDGFAVDQVEASDGQVQRSVSLIPSEDPSRFWFCGGFSLSTGLFYVLDRLSPPDGEVCSDGVTQPQLQAFALPDTPGPYPSPPETTIPATAGASGGGAGSGGNGGGSGGLPPAGVPIVLVPGIESSTRTVQASHQCKGAGEMEYLCKQLSRREHPVYVVGASPGGKDIDGEPVILNSDGDLNANAVALRAFLKNTVPKSALLVAHSMGGLIARIAISRYDAPAAGLFTMGTPYDGSFLADIAAGIDVECATANPSMCALLAILAKSFPALNSPAALEMTWVARIAESLSIPNVPVWTVAGTEIEENAPPSYLSPNDLVVGQTSAHGLTANLGEQEGEFNLPLYHLDPFSLGLLGVKLGALLPVAETETGSATVAGLVNTAANELTDGLRVTKAVQANAASTHQAVTATIRHRTKATTYSVKLFASHTISTTQHLTAGALAVADQSFQAFCGKTSLSLIPLPGDLFALDAADTTCTHPAVTPPRHGTLTVTGDLSAVDALVVIRGNHVTIILKAAQPVRLATLRLGKRTIRLHRSTRELWHLTAATVSNVPAVLTARCDGQTYAASVPL
jgi:pimeloyl-ACP methyl ester carboxylesterase